MAAKACAAASPPRSRPDGGEADITARIDDAIVAMEEDDITARIEDAIVATGDSYRVVDLKSSNCTFLHGNPIDKAEVSYDDVIEIGNTVMVFMDSDAWQRGEGMARLRNPVKAQELIQRIRLNAEKKKRIPVRRRLARQRGADRARDGLRR